jgi:hypothetical protein
MGTTGDAPPPDEARTGAEEGRPHHLAAYRKRLEQVEEALRQWDRRDEAVRRQRERRQAPPLPDVPAPPALARQSLQELRAMLLEELTCLEEHT